MNNISYDQAINLMKNFGVVLIDVQHYNDYQKKHLIGSINIPVEEINSKVETVIKNKNENIIVYCLSGIRSVAACDILNRLGYKNIYNIQGGIEN